MPTVSELLSYAEISEIAYDRTLAPNTFHGSYVLVSEVEGADNAAGFSAVVSVVRFFGSRGCVI